MNSANKTLYVKGMHCNACTLLIRETVSEIEAINDVQVSLKSQTIELIHTDENMSNEDLSALLNPLLQWYGYTVYPEPPVSIINWWEYALAVVLSWTLIFGFLQIQDLWLLQMLNGTTRTFGTSFVIGLIASVSSCLAVVGGVVLGLGTVYANSKSFLPQSLFHVGRLAWFFLLWGVLGSIWSAFQLSPIVSIILNMIIAVVLLVLWMNLLWLIRGGMTFGWGIFKRFSGHENDIVGPLLIGVGTFFLPCGFTQSMQVYTLSTGGFLTGWLTMLSFALGTLPVLLLLSVTGKSIQQSKSSWLFFKTIGIILVILALYNFTSSLVALGIIPPLFTL